MGLFDSIEKMAMDQLGQQGPGFLTQALANTPFGGASGLIEQLVQGGLGPQVAAMAAGQPGASVSPDMLKGVLDEGHVQQLASQFGVDPSQVLGLISQHLPAIAQQQAA